MTIHERMIKHREELGLNVTDMANRIGITPKLLLILEDGGYTLPSIVRDHIRKEYGFTKRECEELLPINLRPHGGDYEPNRYLDPIRAYSIPEKVKPEVLQKTIKNYENMLRL